WRSYYDPFWGGGGYDNWYGGGAYAFSPWASYYNPTYSYGLGLGIGLGFGSPWGYNNPYSYWGPNSYYNYYGAGYAAWGGGYYGMNGFPGYYGGGRVVSNENYRARPVRSGDGAGYINTGRPVGGRTGYVTDGRGNVVPMGRTRGGANMPIPSRGGDVDRSSARPVERPMPTRTQETPRESFPSRVERPSPSPAPSRVSGGGGGGGAPRGGGGGGGRPGRTGG
ncbi:MAG: hypothetical protein INR69_13255, partial [Mucilaginibacter polytrichastri]|nr:hypothetical protein [Mucilaginibacter polytrichastri]